ncbi:hypothetical protein ACFQZJ_14715 [Maribacter chungangensis]|uniref:Cardiolipin synthetase n=1 Tax=Maribacter chungangensis TaxID=1069117 RepID=A0ABW3B600_9FLAO
MKPGNFKKQLLLFLVVTLLWNCKSTELVSNWKDPDTVLFHAYKVLIVGMTENDTVREEFETKIQAEFQKRNVEAVRSTDLFDVDFRVSEQSEKQLNEVEEQLLDKDFDAILFTKIIGSENKKTLRSRLADTDRLFNTFRDDYLSNQGIFYEDSYYDNYTVFHAETALYCICVGKERETIWRAAIDITEPKNFQKTIDEYIKLVISSMEEEDIIFYDAAIK